MRVRVQVTEPLFQHPTEYVDGEDAAVARARELLGPNVLRVCLDPLVSGPDGEWALRHLRWSAGTVTDSLWQVWRDGEQVGSFAPLPWPVDGGGRRRADGGGS